jgi:hypothetical protein
VAEIADGIAKARREGSRRKAAALAGWMATLLHLYGNRILPFDVAAARIAGTLYDRAMFRLRCALRLPIMSGALIANPICATNCTLQCDCWTMH